MESSERIIKHLKAHYDQRCFMIHIGPSSRPEVIIDLKQTEQNCAGPINKQVY